MTIEHDHRNALNQKHDISLSLSPLNFLLCSSLCIICIIVSFRHIKHHRRCRRHCHPSRGGIGTGIHRSIPPERQKSMPETKTSGKATHSQQEQDTRPTISVSGDDAHIPSQDQAPASSPACEILQPLSQLVPVPASGRVAAAVAGRGEAPDVDVDLDLSLPAAAAAEQGDRSQSGTHIPGPGIGAGPCPGHSYEAINDPRHPEENSSHPPDATGPVAMLAGPSAPNVAVQSVASSLSQHCQHYPSSRSADSNSEAQVQKRSETVQFCRDVDAEGVRSWRRLIVEYG